MSPLKIDSRSATWAVIRHHIDQRMRELRATLEGNVPWDGVVATRARLSELKLLLALIDDPEPPLVEPEIELPV